MDASPHDTPPSAEFALWRLHDAGGPVLRLRVRYNEDIELPNWQDGPDLDTALEAARANGWVAFDREPGSRKGEYAIIHLRRAGQPT